MFIIPCKYSKENSYIFNCVSAIRRYHGWDELICVIDSKSEDKSYCSQLEEEYGCHVWGANENYGTNAYAMAYGVYPDEEFYYCIYDSLILQSSLKEYEQYPLTAFRYFKTPPTGWGWDESGNSLEDWAEKQIGTAMPYVFNGIMGPMFMAKREIMESFNVIGLFDIKPTNKYELCAMERIYGIVAGDLGLDFWTHAPQGEMHDFFGDYPEQKVKKINAARM